jgi:hypothetical protein
VPVEKRDGSVRICGDYKLTVNRVSKTEVYPIPKIKEIFASLTGGKKFSKLDLSHAYQQIQLEEESQKYLTVNTHKGSFNIRDFPSVLLPRLLCSSEPWNPCCRACRQCAST